MNLSIQDGRAELWQWDTGIRLVMDEACEAVNISASTFGVTVDVTAAEDGKTWVATVPDEMLQKPGDLICYAVQSTATGIITAAYRSFRVNRRPKPAGYVATPTEARTWQELYDRKIDAPQVAQVGEVLTVEEVYEDGKPTKWKTAPGIRGEKGDTGPAGPKGADGKDGAGMDVTGAKVGQIAKITAVDSAGKPTEWEPVDMPGGGEKWEKIAEIELRSDTAKYVLADFATWRKAKVIMTRTKYISGLDKNVWCKCETPTNGNLYVCVFMTMQYGYIYWDCEAEVNDLFITSSYVSTNYRQSAEGIRSTGILMPLSIAPSECEFTLTFMDTSVIQEGDKVSVIGVRR